MFKVASSDLVNMGISVVSYTLKDVHDDQVTAFLTLLFRSWTFYHIFPLKDLQILSRVNLHSASFLCAAQDYLHSLGKARTAQVQKDARIGEANNKRDAVIRVRRHSSFSPSARTYERVPFPHKHPK